MTNAMKTEAKPELSLREIPVRYQQLVHENSRLYKLLRAMYCDEIAWMDDHDVSGHGRFRAGLFDLQSAAGPSLALIYEDGSNPDPIIRVGPARKWSERLLASRHRAHGRDALRAIATDVLRYLGEHKL